MRNQNVGKSIFSQRLEELRLKQGKSCVVISELCGLHPDAIRRYEHGEAEPGMKSLIAIADYFQVSIDYLVGWGE